MTHLRLLHLQATTRHPLRQITDDVRGSVSRLCGGLDDLQRLGNKALVVRAEIYPENVLLLESALAAIGVNADRNSTLFQEGLQCGLEYPLTIQITSFADDTDEQVLIPQVPG